VFFMATNHQDSFDPAIKRPGRFDLLLCVGPPTWAEKLHRMDVVLKNVNNAGKSQKVKELADGFVGHGRFNKHRHLLDLFTFSEIRTFLSQLRDAVKQKTIQEALEAAGEAGFLSLVEGFSEHITLRRAPRGVFPRPGTVLRQFLRDRKQSRIQ
jgi:SpoVK/Ycf46/Vps4 family AAA+-type ATPase